MELPKLDHQNIVHLLTAVIVVVWIASAVVRIWVDWPEAKILDSAIGLVIPYWFVTTAATAARKNGVHTS